jgi:hypothetical protein
MPRALFYVPEPADALGEGELEGVAMATRFVTGIVLTALTLSVAACRSETTQVAEAPGTAPAANASHEGHVGARVFFVEPKNGATVKSPVKFVFGNDQVQIAPVPAGEVKEARADMGHYHLGVDADCLPAGTVIPKAEPGATPGNAGSWIHFGTGSNNIEMSLTPGPHKFSVEVGDDLHRAVAGLCETISVTVE